MVGGRIKRVGSELGGPLADALRRVLRVVGDGMRRLVGEGSQRVALPVRAGEGVLRIGGGPHGTGARDRVRAMVYGLVVARELGVTDVVVGERQLLLGGIRVAPPGQETRRHLAGSNCALPQ